MQLKSEITITEYFSDINDPRYIIKNFLGVSISDQLSGIAIPSKMVAKGIAQKLLGKLGLKLTYVGRIGSRDNRERVYKSVEPKDERDAIYQAWQNRVVGVHS
jgi:hypothetical protein